MTERIQRPTCLLVRRTGHFAFSLHLITAVGLCPFLAPLIDEQATRAAEVPAADDAQPSIVYRRIFVPADNVAAWPREGEKYLPIESREFEAWVEAANSARGQARASASISEAHYSARLEDDRLVAGRGQWNITLPSDETGFLRLGNMSLVVRGARWQNSPQRPARLGAWGQNGGTANTVGLEVTDAGILDFDWEAQSKSTHDEIEISWKLPIATTTKVFLDLPEGKQPHIDGGVVVKSERLNSAADTVNRRRWELACNSSHGTVLRILDARPTPTPDMPGLSLRDEAGYHFTQRGVNIVATWHLDDADGKRRELVLPLPRGVQLISAVADGHEINWRVVSADNVDRAVLDIAKLATRRPLQITLRAWHPLTLDRPWQLPKLRPEGVFWASGSIELSIADEMELRALAPRGCVETGVNALADATAGPETWRLAAFAPTAEVEVTIARRPPEATIRMGSSLALADPDISGRLVTQWNVAQGSVHSFSAEVATSWIVEAVETIPADALREWFIDRQKGRKHIEIQLSRAASAAHDVTVIVSGRLPRSGFTDQISAETIRMVTWRGARVAEHLLTFQTTDPFAVAPVGTLPEIAADKIGDDRQALLESDALEGTVFDLAQAGEGAGLKLIVKPGQYTADIRLDVTLARQELRQAHDLVITPTSNRVDRLLIYSTVPLGEHVHWTDSQSHEPLSAERLPKDHPGMAAVPAGGELWLVRLPRPTTRAVEITATTSTPWPSRSRLPLLAMPEAIEQHGRVFVRAATDDIRLVEPHDMPAIPLPLASGDSTETADQPPISAAYRFNPMDCLDVTRSPQLWIGPDADLHLSALIARRVELESFFSSNGNASHRATYHLENQGAATFDVQLPHGAVLETISVDGRVVNQPVASASGELSPIRLPFRTGSATVSISFGTRQSPLAAGSKLMPPIVETPTPVLVGEWTIRLPDEFSVSTAADLNWRQRLFGPLGRPNGTRPFQPPRAADWAMLVNSITGSRSGVSSSSGSPPGWHVYHTMFIAERPSAVHIAHPSATTTWAVSIFLLCLAGGVSVGSRRKDLFFVLLAAGAGLALLLPSVFAPLATGAVLGLLLSLIAPAWRRRYEPETGASSHWGRLSTVGVLAFAVTFALSMPSFGQPSDAPNSSDRPLRVPTIHRLFIPVDAEGRPTGTKYYVSERFLRGLLRSAAEQSSPGAQWLLRDVSYTGELRERAEPSGIVAEEWTIACDIEVLARDTTIVLPLVHEEATWPASAMLDGVPTPLVWREDRGGCAIEIAEPGRYSLVITCMPTTSVSQGRNLVTLTIPPRRGATFRLNHPPEMTGVTVSGAQSQWVKNAPDTREYKLNDTDKLEVRWPAFDMTASDSQGLRVTELKWLHIGVDEVTLDVKYILEGSAPRPEEVIVAFNPGWELVPDEKPRIEARVEVESGDRSLVKLQLPPDVAERQEILLRWRLTKGGPLGRLQLPDIELISVPITQRWRGVSTAASLVGEVVDGSAQPGSVAEFLALWGDAGAVDAPQIVLGNLEASDVWNVTVTPRQTESEIDEVLHLAAGSHTLRIVYEAAVVPGSDHKYQFPLTIPAGLSIDEIVLTQADQPVPLRWARVAENRVNVFLSEEMVQEYQIVLHGTMPADSPSTLALPRVGAADADGAVTTVHLYRDEDVTIDVRGLPQAEESLDALELPPASWTARHVGSYRLDEAAADKVRLEIQPNHVELTGDTLTTLLREPDGWFCEFQYDLSVEKGLLGTLRLRVPPTWAGPFTLDSNVAASIEVISEDNQPAMLLIRFAEPLATGSAVNLQIRSPLTLAATSSVSVPEITSERTIDGSHYIRVPASLDERPIAWNEVGVRKTELPKEIQPSSDALQEPQSFEVVATPFQVTLQPPVEAAHAALVRLADTTVSADEVGRQLILTRLVVEPHGVADCMLRLPRNQQLVAVRLDGRPALIRPAGPANWRVPLGPPQLPCVLEIVSRLMETPSDRRYSELRRPVLLSAGEPIPVEINLWSFGLPLKSQRASIGVASEVSVADQAVLRFDRLLGIAETATPAAVESTTPDGYNWYRPWASLLKTLRQEALEKMAKPLDRRVASQVSRPLEEQLIKASGRLDQWIEQCNEMLVGPELDTSSQDSTNHTLFASPDTTQVAQGWVYCVTDGGLDRLTIHLAPDTAVSSQLQPVGLVAIASLLTAALLLIRWPAAQDFLYRWPHAIGFLTGIAFWAWLRPSWCGLLIAGTCLLLAWHPGWPGRAVRLEGSTVLRASRPK